MQCILAYAEQKQHLYFTDTYVMFTVLIMQSFKIYSNWEGQDCSQSTWHQTNHNTVHLLTPVNKMQQVRFSVTVIHTGFDTFSGEAPKKLQRSFWHERIAAVGSSSCWVQTRQCSLLWLLYRMKYQIFHHIEQQQEMF